MKTIVLNGENAILGRIGTYAAKELLKGNSVSIINCEEIVISGRGELVVEELRRKRKMGRGGSLKGPLYVNCSDKLVKRIIRGMLPWDKPRGREAYRRFRCYVGGGDLGKEALKNIVELKFKIPFKYIKIKDVVKALK
jgi:large subunit ribosomal protein L13